MNPTEPIFQRLLFWRGAKNLDGPANMAADEVLLRSRPEAPVLRVYGWARPTISLGYFAPLPETDAEVVRRWTGGGLVDHRGGHTYSLIVPRGESFARERPQCSYLRVHAAIRAVLADFGVESRLAGKSREPAGLGCFAGGWAEGDLLVEGRKIAGAAQRRCREGLLHQGSVRLDDWREEFWRALAEKLAAETVSYEPGGDFFERVDVLARARYASADWLNRSGC